MGHSILTDFEIWALTLPQNGSIHKMGVSTWIFNEASSSSMRMYIPILPEFPLAYIPVRSWRQKKMPNLGLGVFFSPFPKKMPSKKKNAEVQIFLPPLGFLYHVILLGVMIMPWSCLDNPVQTCSNQFFPTTTASLALGLRTACVVHHTLDQAWFSNQSIPKAQTHLNPSSFSPFLSALVSMSFDQSTCF